MQSCRNKDQSWGPGATACAGNQAHDIGSATSGAIEPYNGARRILHGSTGRSCSICDSKQPEMLSGIPMAVLRCAQRLLLGGMPFCCGCWRALQLQHFLPTLARRGQETIVQVPEKSVIGLVTNCGSQHSTRECGSLGLLSTIHRLFICAIWLRNCTCPWATETLLLEFKI